MLSVLLVLVVVLVVASVGIRVTLNAVYAAIRVIVVGTERAGGERAPLRKVAAAHAPTGSEQRLMRRRRRALGLALSCAHLVNTLHRREMLLCLRFPIMPRIAHGGARAALSAGFGHGRAP